MLKLNLNPVTKADPNTLK